MKRRRLEKSDRASFAPRCNGHGGRAARWLGAFAVPLFGLVLSNQSSNAGQLGYVADGEGSIAVFDTDTDEVVKTIPIPVRSPFATLSLLLSARDRRLFVLLKEGTSPIAQPSKERRSVFVIDTTAHRVTATMTLEPPTEASDSDLAELHLSEDGTRLYVGRALDPGDGPQEPGQGGVLLFTLDPADLHVLAAIPVPISDSDPFPPTLAPDRGRIYSVTAKGNLVVVDAATGDLVTEIRLPPDVVEQPTAMGAVALRRLVLAPSQATLAVNDVLVDLGANRILGRVLDTPVNEAPVALFSEDSATFFVLTRGQPSSVCGRGSDATDLVLSARDVVSFQPVARLSLGPASVFSPTPWIDGRRLTMVMQRCANGPRSLRVVEMPDGVVRSIHQATDSTADMIEIAHSADGGREIFVETSSGSRGGVANAQPPLVSELLEVDMERGELARRVDLGDFMPSRPTSGVFTRDGSKLYLIGPGGALLGATEVRTLTSGRGFGHIGNLGLRPQQIVLGDPCASADGCVCRTDADCDDGNPCTDDICIESRRCSNPIAPCIEGVRCLSEDRRAEQCLSAPQQKLSDQTRRRLAAAGGALVRGDAGRARELLDRAVRDVKRLLAITIKLTHSAPPKPLDVSQDECATPFARQLRLVQSLRDARHSLTECTRHAQ